MNNVCYLLTFALAFIFKLSWLILDSHCNHTCQLSYWFELIYKWSPSVCIFPFLVLRLAREAGLEYVEIQSLTDFYDDNRFESLSMLTDSQSHTTSFIVFLLLLSKVVLHCWCFSPLLVRAQFASLLMNAGPNFVDPRGKLLPRAFDLLGKPFHQRMPS